jgi:hypothetical protein
MVESDKQKLVILLNYWIEHNREHRDEFREWAEKAKGFARVNIHGHILKAAQQMDKANEFLLRALKGLTEGKEETNVSG